jgi:hypothetical protein
VCDDIADITKDGADSLGSPASRNKHHSGKLSLSILPQQNQEGEPYLGLGLM